MTQAIDDHTPNWRSRLASLWHAMRSPAGAPDPGDAEAMAEHVDLAGWDPQKSDYAERLQRQSSRR